MPKFIPSLQLNADFYEMAVRPTLAQRFPDLRYSAALLGPGSDVLGYDDVISTDHDWGPRLQLFVDRDDYIESAEMIIHTLAHELPYTFRGYSTHFTPPAPQDSGTQRLQAVGEGPINHRITIHTLRSFVYSTLYFDIEQPLMAADWLTFSQQRLLGLTAGAVYRDEVGLEELRARFAYYPDDVWLYLLAAGWQRISQEEHLMGRAGSVGDEIGSALIAARLVRDIIHLAFLMARQYAPYAKWLGTAFQELACAETLGPILRRALGAETWQLREQALAQAYEQLAKMHNALAVTPPVATQTTPFFDRPFRVITSNGVVDQLRVRLADGPLSELAGKPLIGSLDQWSDSTDMTSDLRWRPTLRQLYV